MLFYCRPLLLEVLEDLEPELELELDLLLPEEKLEDLDPLLPEEKLLLLPEYPELLLGVEKELDDEQEDE